MSNKNAGRILLKTILGGLPFIYNFNSNELVKKLNITTLVTLKNFKNIYVESIFEKRSHIFTNI